MQHAFDLFHHQRPVSGERNNLKVWKQCIYSSQSQVYISINSSQTATGVSKPLSVTRKVKYFGGV